MRVRSCCHFSLDSTVEEGGRHITRTASATSPVRVVVASAASAKAAGGASRPASSIPTTGGARGVVGGGGGTAATTAAGSAASEEVGVVRAVVAPSCSFFSDMRLPPCSEHGGEEEFPHKWADPGRLCGG